MPNILKGKSRWIGGLFLAALLPAADAASPATPGMINYVEGQVTLEGQTLTTKSVGSVDLEPNQVLSSDHGKAEILLTPGVFLRIGNNSAVRMISPELTDTQVELLNGEAMVEVTQLLKGNAITVVDHGATTLLEKTGLYDFKAAPPQTAVYDGKAEVSMDGRKITLKKGKEIDLLGQSKPQHFDTKAPESLFAWSNLRSEYLAEASYGSANTLAVNGGWYGPGWYWNPYWDMYSFMPDGFLYSPFGWGFYSPGVLWGGFGGYGYGGFHRGYGYAGGRGFRGGAMGHPAFHGTPRGGFAGGGFHGGGGGFHGGGGGFHGGGGGFHGGGGGGRGR